MDRFEVLLCAEEMVASPWFAESNKVKYCDIAHDHSYDHNAFFTEFSVEDDAAITCLFEKEGSHMPGKSYVSALHQTNFCSTRLNAIQWMLKVFRLYKFGPLTITLAVNYLDRYLSIHLLSRSWKAWMIQLLSIACLSLAAKMEELDVPLRNFQVEGLDNIFDVKTIQRMELAVLSSLEWRMSSVTPFAYVDFLLHKLGILDRAMKASLLTRFTELVLGILSEPNFLEFRPSILALAASRCALEETVPLQAEIYKCCLSNLLPVENDKLERCYILMQELLVDPLYPVLSFTNVTGTKSPVDPFSMAELMQNDQNLGELEDEVLQGPCVGHPNNGQTVYISSSYAISRKRKICEVFK